MGKKEQESTRDKKEPGKWVGTKEKGKRKYLANEERNHKEPEKLGPWDQKKEE